MNSPMMLGFSPTASNLTVFFHSDVLSLYFPHWNPGLCSLSRFPVVPPGLSACKFGTTHSTSGCLTLSISCCLAQHTHLHLAHPGPSATALLQVLSAQLPVSTPPTIWMNVYSLSPWFSDFHTVGFSVSFGCLLFLSLLFPFFWLCKEA